MPLYVVTGGAGFIGSHLVDALLAQGHRVRVVDDLSTGHRRNLDPRAELLVADVATPGVMGRALAGADGCFHLAAIASVAKGNEDWLGTHRSNQTATIAVFDAARDNGRLPVVYASSAAVYGAGIDGALHEDLVPQPLSAYGADKLGCELHARVAQHVHGTATIGLRFFNVYGPRQDPCSPYSGVISIFAAGVRNRRPLTINGDGGQTRDFIFVADVVAHLTAAMARLRTVSEAIVLNVCTGRATSILDLAHTLASYAGHRPNIRFAAARPGDIRASVGCPSRARRTLAVADPIPLVDGLAALLDAEAMVLKLAV